MLESAEKLLIQLAVLEPLLVLPHFNSLLRNKPIDW